MNLDIIEVHEVFEFVYQYWFPYRYKRINNHQEDFVEVKEKTVMLVFLNTFSSSERYDME